MKILIAGGAGFIGTRLSNHLCNLRHEVTVVDYFWFGDHLKDDIVKVKKDLTTLQKSDLEGFDAVIFLAGLSNDPMANFDPKKNFIENAAAPTYLAYMAKQAGVPRYVYASSCSVYGFTENQIMSEDSKVAPQYPYGISKLQSEYSIMNMADENFRPIAMRKGTVGGWSPRMRFDLVVNTMTKFALTKGKITVHNPKLWRPLIDIRDVVDAYTAAALAPKEISEVFNVCTENYTIGDLADRIKSELVNFGHNVELEIQQKEDVRNYLSSNDKIKRMLNFDPKYTPEDSVREVVQNISKFKLDLEDDVYYNINTFKKLKI